MREAALFGIAIACFAGIAFRGVSPEAETSDAAAVEQARAEVAARDSKNAFASWSAGETVLARAADGHFYADVSVNGASVDFMIDTGASMVALTGADAQAAGLYWSDADVRPVARGASGPVYGVPVRIDRVSLGGHEATNVEGVIVPEGLDVSLLGQSFLQTIEPVRIEGERMVLGQ
ncbi:TIGR02281 family clan AA aspartic protease [Qipengyuania sp. 6B39]|uniref:retropepsin-like aspartic protease family protein n=1 Tax=Qipengyuania proteolytica TaxID=2867239 RepID=UPI001C890022|nr:TIGR02281 family clan AA aspartic protease [Qipengyuania proteolytica]MBX7494982.1 TIGR02281 family clan AA aspartic protease [Qipengyuania proteolytica]